MENNEIKYIVYCTTNIVNKYIYVGVHKVSVNNIQDTYIGCGCYSNQPSTYNKPETRFQCAVKEFGPSKFIRKTLKVFDNEEDAYLMEADIVDEAFLARHDVYNMILGGKCSWIDKSTPTYKYSLEGEFLEEYPSMKDAARAVDRNLRTIQRAIKDRIKGANYFWTTEKFEKLDLSLFKTEEESRGFPVYQYSDTGEYECCYESIRDCARIIGASDSNLGIAIKVGTKCNGKYYTTIFAENYSISKSEKIKNTTVYQYDLQGNFIKEWDSANKARKALGFTSDIYKAIKLGRTAGGFQWSLEKLSYMEPECPKAGKARRIGKFDLDGNLIKEYTSIVACKKENGAGLTHVLDGRDKTHKGYTYKYLD